MSAAKATTRAVYALAAMLALHSCTESGSLKPQSGGSPYEVLVATDNDTVRHSLTAALTADVAGLPQPEAAFDVSHTGREALTQATRYARCIVIARTDSGLYPQTKIRYEKNVYARPQLIVYVTSPSPRRLSDDMARTAPAMRALIERFETNTETARLKRQHNAQAEKAVSDIIGCGILIPADMRSIKRGKDFVWLSDNSASAMRNICVYAYPDSRHGTAASAAIRDSVMKANIPGETDGMYMRTSTAAPYAQRTTAERGQRIVITRGLWEMKGDAMGGPFVSHAVADSRHGRIIVAEGFVYAPGQKKRNIMKQLEAALYTLRLSK